MRVIATIVFFFAIPLISKSQMTLTSVCGQVSEQWKIDSNSCKGYRLKVAESLTKAQKDSISKDFLFSKLGKPNIIQRFSSGYPRKDYVEYIYYIYKDNCPKINVEGASIGFVFDKTETYFIRIDDHDYCG
jgi:hypothetical protein